MCGAGELQTSNLHSVPGGDAGFLGGAVCICATCRDSGAGGRSRQHQHDMAAWGRVSRVAHHSRVWVLGVPFCLSTSI